MTLNETLQAAASKHEVSVDDILSHSRRRRTVAARHEAMRALRDKGWSYPEIGDALNRDHTSVMHACRKGEA